MELLRQSELLLTRKATKASCSHHNEIRKWNTAIILLVRILILNLILVVVIVTVIIVIFTFFGGQLLVFMRIGCQ